MKEKNIYFQEAKLAGLKRSVARAWLLLLAIVALKAGMAQSVTVTTFADLKTHLEAGHDVILGANIVADYGTITIPACCHWFGTSGTDGFERARALCIRACFRPKHVGIAFGSIWPLPAAIGQCTWMQDPEDYH